MANITLGMLLHTAGNEPIGTTSGKLHVRAAEIETLLSAIDGHIDGLEEKDYATQTTLAAVLAKLSADPATQTTLAALLTAFNVEDFASQTTLASVAAKLDTLIAKDYATQTTLAALKTALDAMVSTNGIKKIVDGVTFGGATPSPQRSTGTATTTPTTIAFGKVLDRVENNGASGILQFSFDNVVWDELEALKSWSSPIPIKPTSIYLKSPSTASYIVVGV